jgi:hypothetical protein
MRFSGGGQKTLNMERTANPAVHCNRRVGLLPVFGMLSHGALRVRKLHIETEPSRRNISAGPPLPLIAKKIPPTNIKPPPTPQNIAIYGLGNDHCKSLKIRFMIDAPNIQGERREAAAADVRFVSEPSGCLPFAPPCWFDDVFMLGKSRGVLSPSAFTRHPAIVLSSTYSTLVL